MEKDRAFLQRLLATFRGEAGEHVRVLSAGLLELERGGEAVQHTELVETLFRGMHSLKGAARAVGKREIEALCQAAEGVFAALKERRRVLSPPLVDLLHGAADMLAGLVAALDREPDAAQRAAVAELRRRLAAATDEATETAAEAAPAGSPIAPAAVELPVPPPATMPPPAETVRVTVARLDAVLFQAEALLAAKLAGEQRQRELGEAAGAFAVLARDWAEALPQARELQAAAKRFEGRLATLVKGGDQGRRHLAGLVDGLLDNVKMLLMLPLSAALEVLPKVARDLAREQGKEVTVTISGGGVEIDRRILEEIRDPLIHLLRNAIDHGIELPEARLQAGKPRRGTISVAASPLAGGRIEIRVADDGGGVDFSRLAAAAASQGLADAAATPAELLPLVFHSGLSTSPLITDISGRGLGLAIVREKAERLGGSVDVESSAGAGTLFRLTLPLTLATFHGVHVRAGGADFIFPTMGLERVMRLPRAAVRSVENRETVPIDGRPVALVRLAEVLELAAAVPAETATLALAVAGSGERRVAFAVDAVLGELEVLAKGLGRQLTRVRNIAGATVLGNGKVVPILYIPDLLKSAARPGPAVRSPPAAPARRRTVLVAEDSITSRILLQGILEAAGYQVATAVDGLDAYTRLCTEPFDLLVSDVDMPRLNGFDLTARIRADRRFAELPVVLVTALESREHRERGAEVGANAYIVKSSFDQENLLAAVGRLL